jgi:hypothetical protein
MTPILRDHPVPVMSVLGVIGLIWMLDAVGSTRAVLTRLALLLLAGYGIYDLRRRCIADFPNAKMGDLPERMRARIDAMRARRASHRHGVAVPQSDPEDRRLERLERLATLHDSGALNDEEFEAEKAALLRGAASGPAA